MRDGLDGVARTASPVRVTVLALVAEPETRALFPKVVVDGVLHLTSDLTEGLALAQTAPPDVAFVEIGMGEGAGLAMIHHLKALAPNMTIFALASKNELDVGAHAVALGGTGLLLLPVGGDEILSALSQVRARLADRSALFTLEAAAAEHARALEWMTTIAALGESPSRGAAAATFVATMVEATSATGGALYLAADRSNELTRVAATPSFERAPAFGLEEEILELARREGQLVVALTARGSRTGQLVLSGAGDAIASSSEGLARLLVAQATTAFELLAERERAGGGALKDPTSSAYSFAYYVDVAGREIDKARRWGRRFAIATIAFDPSLAERLGPATMADQLLLAARDTDVLARVDDHEFHVLMPEADGLAAHALRRRVFARFADDASGSLVPRGVLVGVATFPHDGSDLAQLLRQARRRADATKASFVHRLHADQATLDDLLEALEWEVASNREFQVSAAQPLQLELPEAMALATTVVGDAVRGGTAFVAVANSDRLGVGAAVRSALATPREGVTFHALDVKAEDGAGIEALSVLAEHGAYALLGRSRGGVVRGLHAADPLLADILAERLGRAAGLRIFAG